MEMLDTLFTFKKKNSDRKIYINSELYIQFGNGLAKYIGLYKIVKEYKTCYKAYLCRLTHEEWRELIKENRLIIGR